MRAKAYLIEIGKLDRKIENKQMEIEHLRGLLESVTPRLKEINVQSSLDGDKMGDTIAKIIELQEQINAEIDKFVDRKLEAMRLINQLGDDDCINILIRRYINYEEWEDIAQALHFSRQWVDKKHGLALLEFQKIIDVSLHEFT